MHADRHQRPADREHLLLAAARSSRRKAGAFKQDWEHVVYLGQRDLDPLPPAMPIDHVRTEKQIVAHAHRAKHLPPLKHLADAELNDLMRLNASDQLPVKLNYTGRWCQKARDSAQQRGFPCAIGTKHTDTLPGLCPERHVEKDLD